MAFPNKYAGSCDNCGARVAVAAGMTDKVGGRWIVYCGAHAPTKAKPKETAVAAVIAAPFADLFADLPTAVKLYDHQKDGIGWMRGRGLLGGILADDMGLGKTLQALAAIPVGANGKRLPTVVVCPAVAKLVWQREAAKFAPDLKVTVLTGKGSFRWPVAGEAVVTNFEIMPPVEKRGDDKFATLDPQVEAAMPDGLVLIVDEAHKVKNWAAQRTQSMRAVSFACRKRHGRVFLLTGTPLTNDPTETYSLLVAGGLQFETFKGDKDAAMRLAGGWRGRYGWEFNANAISGDFAAALKPVMLRRRKDEVLNLPPKRRETLPCEIGPCHEADVLVQKFMAAGVDVKDPYMTLKKMGDTIGFEQMSRAREALARAKTKAATELAKSWTEDGEQIIVFSAHLAPVEACGTLAGFATITGDTSTDERARIEADFQAGKIKGIAATIKAAGVALTLTAATRVLFVDLAWTPADNEQAEDRAYRIGQTKSVLITTLVANHDLDERIAVLLAHKQDLIDGAIETARVKQGEAVVMPVAAAPAPIAAPVDDEPVTAAPVAPVVVDTFADLMFL